MNILQKIVEKKKAELQLKKKTVPEAFLRMKPYYNRECYSLKKALSEAGTGIIAEFKRQSPSKGWIKQGAQVSEIVPAYAEGGASGISILTDEHFFGGGPEDLLEARELVEIPLLRKDFIVDDYQVAESKALGADLILLIAACLTREQVRKFAYKAKSCGLEVLLEIHTVEEIGHICENVDLVGVNNRDLKTFKVDINQSVELAAKISPGKVLISESGINAVADIELLKNHGYKGFLVGEKFMKEKNPGGFLKEFLAQIDKG